jgi:gas vesicle protein
VEFFPLNQPIGFEGYGTVFLKVYQNIKNPKNCVMENSSKIILGLVGAAAVGVAIGMLLAPEKGSEIRKKISDKAGDLASRVGDLVSYGKDKFDEVAGSVTRQADGILNDAVKRSDRVKETIA